VEDAEAILIGVAYFRVGDGKRIDMDTPLRITPATVERERFGSIEATVTTVSPFAVTTDAVASVVGNEDVARELLQQTTKIQVYADLQRDPRSHTGFKWTSGTGPDTEISAGTTTTVRATIEYRRPITFVIPLLRRWSGI
jgi:HlyD family secretion protein